MMLVGLSDQLLVYLSHFRRKGLEPVARNPSRYMNHYIKFPLAFRLLLCQSQPKNLRDGITLTKKAPGLIA